MFKNLRFVILISLLLIVWPTMTVSADPPVFEEFQWGSDGSWTCNVEGEEFDVDEHQEVSVRIKWTLDGSGLEPWQDHIVYGRAHAWGNGTITTPLNNKIITYQFEDNHSAPWDVTIGGPSDGLEDDKVLVIVRGNDGHVIYQGAGHRILNYFTDELAWLTPHTPWADMEVFDNAICSELSS